jgi:glycosyltransferase involved in cell wall biosynthesis
MTAPLTSVSAQQTANGRTESSHVTGQISSPAAPAPALKVLLVGNHPFAGVPSMEIFAETLRRELSLVGMNVESIVPRPVIGRFKRSGTGLGKWFSYCDRFLFFPRHLRAAAARADVVHVCDHSDAMYAPMVKGPPVMVTCHDMLAVRRSLGEVDDEKPSRFGPLLQRWVCRGLRHASRVACVSQYTLADAARILPQQPALCLVENGLNHSFQSLPDSETTTGLDSIPALRKRFVLHVGSSHPRKNREGVLRVFAQAADDLDLQLVFAGAPLHPELVALAEELQVLERVVQVVRPRVEIMEMLYNRAAALLFPSKYEGFGWPPIEAQACGCPVIASDIPPLAEVLGESAVLKSLQDEAGMASSLRRLILDASFSDDLRQRGFENVATRFQTARMIRGYISLYQTLVLEAADAAVKG